MSLVSWFARAMSFVLLGLYTVSGWGMSSASAAEEGGRKIVRGFVQNQDLRRIPQAVVQVKDQEGNPVATAVTDDAGEFAVTVPQEGTYSVSAVQETYRSEYVIVKIGTEPPPPIRLTLALTQEIALEVVSPLPPIQYKASSETYSVSRKDIEALPRGNNSELHDVLLTIPSATYGALKQLHIRQDHANLQFRIDGVPIPDTVSSTFTDVITPRAWERADIILGGMEAQYGWRTAAVIDITSKSGTRPGFGSFQMFGGSNETLNPSFEYGGTVGEKFRYYVLNSYTSTNRGIEPPTLGHSVFHGQSERNQTYLRGDYQHDNHNNFTWLFLNSVAKYQIPTTPGLAVNPDVLTLLQAQNPAFNPVASQAIDENQKEHNQYAHMVWRHDLNASNFFSLAGYFRQTRAIFRTDPFNVLAHVADPDEPFSAADQDRMAYSGGVRLDYTYVHSKEHLIKTGFQIDRTQAINKTRLFAFQRDPGTGEPVGDVLGLDADNRLIGWRQEFWLQDQWTPNEHWTFNLGVRGDAIQYQMSEGQISPRVGVTYKYDNANVFHAFYGRLFTPPNLEAISFAKLNAVGTTAEPENLTNNTVRAERSHYFEVGSYHALTSWATLELTGYYKLNRYQSDAGQFGTTPLLNFFAFERGWQRGIDGALKLQVTDNLTARGNVAWGQCKGYGLQSGHFLLEQKEIDDINSPGGVFCDHMQLLTSSAVVSYKILERTTISGQMLYGSGLRTAENEGAKTNSTHSPSYTVYNLSINHVIPLPWDRQKFLIGFDVINLLDQKYFINQGEGSIGLGVAHAGMPRSFFFRGQWFF
ncbi:MAG TPA: TonB-dependent receptor [Nitrospiraceae bacterium]|jgi:outer membrane receptor protein involved in Fe transport|nr:TonB-dependent receptor [Nitrospiraceae bacterium]